MTGEDGSVRVSAADYREWLETTGFTSVRAVHSPMAPLHVLIHAVRRG